MSNATHQTGYLQSDAEHMAEILKETAPTQETLTMYGRSIPVPRLTQWFGTGSYSFSGTTRPAAKLPAALESIRRRVSKEAGVEFNSVLLNLYRDGKDSVSWHADDEKEIGPVIASLSLGAERTFKTRCNATREVIKYQLGKGSLLIMPAGFQRTHQHCLPKTKRTVGVRMNLTFRTVG